MSTVFFRDLFKDTFIVLAVILTRHSVPYFCKQSNSPSYEVVVELGFCWRRKFVVILIVLSME